MKTKKPKTIKEFVDSKSPDELNKIFKHGKPMSRRDFLSAGVIQFAATMTLPPLINVLANAKVAQAAACTANGPSLAPFVTLNLSGGANMAGNYIPHDKGGELLQSYSRVGLGSRGSIATRMLYEFNNAPFFDQSGFLSGLRATATQTTIDRTAFVAIPVSSLNDSSSNKFDISGLVQKAGLAGAILPNMGRRDSATGIGQQPAFQAPLKPLQVTRHTDIDNALGVSGSLSALNDSQKQSVFSLISNLSASQSRELASVAGGDALGELVKSATGDNVTLVSSRDNGTDPLRDQDVSAQLSTAWADAGGNTLDQLNDNSTNRVFASMVYNALKGNAGSVSLELGGYDYHGNGRINQDARDVEAGRVMGQVLESAAIMNKPLFMIVTSDGGVGSDSLTPGADFTSDRSAGAIYMFAFDPNNRPATNGFQVGHFKPGSNEQAPDETFLTGGSAELAALAAFVNYLSFNDRLSLFESVIPRIWNSTQIDMVKKISKA